MPIPTQWNNITPNFSGSAQSMGTATENFNQVGALSNQYLQNARQEAKDKQEEARYQAEQARLKVADDRATTTWDQEQQKIADAKLLSQGLAGMSVPEAVEAPAVIGTQQQTTVPVQGVPQTLKEAYTASRVVPGRPEVQAQPATPAMYGNANPSIAFKGRVTETVKPTNAVATAQPIGDVLSYKKDKYGRVQPSFSGENLGAKIEETLPMTTSLVKGLLGTNENAKKLAMLKGPNGQVIADELLGGGLTKENRTLLREAIIKDRSLSTNIPASSARNPNAAGQALLDAFDKDYKSKVNTAVSGVTTKTSIKDRTTALNDINTSTLYTKNGQPITAANVGDGKELFYATKKDRVLVPQSAVNKAIQTKSDSWVQGKNAVDYQPGTSKHVEYVTGTKSRTVPTYTTNPVTGVQEKSGTMPTKELANVVTSQLGSQAEIVAQSTKGSRSDVLAKMVTDNTKRIMEQYPNLDYITVLEATKKAAGLIIPDGTLTQKEEAATNAKIGDLTRKQTVEDTLRKQEFEMRKQNDQQMFEQGMQGQRLSAQSREGVLNRAVSKATQDKLPPGWTYDRVQDPKTGKVSMVPVPLSALNATALAGITQKTPAGRAAAIKDADAAYESYKKSGERDWWLDKSPLDRSEWEKTRPTYIK